MTLAAFFQKFWLLPAERRRVLLQAAILLPVIGLMLRLVGYDRVYSTLLHRSVKNGAPPNGISPEAVALMVAVVVRRHLYKGKCLQQSLTLWYLLRRRGLDPELRIGVRKAGDQLEAHAWVQYQGRALNDSEDVGLRYTAFKGLTLPSARWV